MNSRRALGGSLLLVGLTVLPVMLWVAAAPLEERFGGELTETLEAVAMIFGIAGAACFSLNLVLASRLVSVQRLFGGLESLYRVHRAVGRLVFVLVALHTAFIVGSQAAISTSEVFGVFRPGEQPVAFVGLVALVGLVVGIALTLFANLGHELFIYVQRFLGFVFVVAAFHFFATEDVKEVPALQTYLIFLVGAGLAAFAYRSIFVSMLARRSHCEVVEVTHLDEAVVEITLQPPRHLEFVPGQFVFASFSSEEMSEALRAFKFSAEEISLRPGRAKNQFHPFSLTSDPGDRNFKLVVKAVGDYTEVLTKIRVGATARVEGPYGEFTNRKVNNTRQIWIAGGIGITPFLSMARSLGTDYDVDLYYCVNNLKEAHFNDELAELAAEHPSFRVHAVPDDEIGHITADHVEERSGLDDQDILMCGPPPMVDGLRAQLVAKGVSSARIHSERFSFGPRPAAVREETGAGDHSGAKHWRRIAFLSVGLAAVAAATFLVVRQPSRRAAATEGVAAVAAESSSVAFPDSDESALLGHVPSSAAGSCDRWIFDEEPTGVVASITCYPGPEQVVYTQFDSGIDMTSFFEDVKVSTSFTAFTDAPNSGTCQTEPAYYAWTNADSSPGGEVLCFNDTSTSGGAYIYWTSTPLEIVSFAWRTDFDQPALYRWWLNESGPVSSR